jgi:hypothetical protein
VRELRWRSSGGYRSTSGERRTTAHQLRSRRPRADTLETEWRDVRPIVGPAFLLSRSASPVTMALGEV